eukprot:218760_1
MHDPNNKPYKETFDTMNHVFNNEILLDKYNETMVNNISNILKECNELIVKENIKYNINNLNINIIQKMIDWSLAWFEDYESLFKEESYYRFFDDEPDYNDDINMQGKFGLFIQMMAHKLNKDFSKYIDIKLNKIVQQIKFINDKQMEIILQNGEIYKCKHVIVCVSICCLQQRTIQFKPDLCTNIWNEIDNSWGMYKSNKIILHFEDSFVKNNHINKLSILSKQPNYTLDNSGVIIPGMYQKYCMASKLDQKDNIWVMFLSPRFGQELYDIYKQKINIEENDYKEKENIVNDMNKNILNDVIEIFKQIFCENDDEQKYELPKLKKWHVTNWDKNDFYRGSWCYWKYNGNGMDACKIIQNIENKNLFDVKDKNNCKYDNNLLFAGEWTESGNGCCWNAIQAGRRAAQQIVDKS